MQRETTLLAPVYIVGITVSAIILYAQEICIYWAWHELYCNNGYAKQACHIADIYIHTHTYLLVVCT